MPKVRTNLSPDELEKVAKGLKALAKQKRCMELPTHTYIEKTLTSDVEDVMDLYSKSLQSEFSRILFEED